MRTLFSTRLIAAFVMAFFFGEAKAAVDKDVVLAMPFEEGKGKVTKDISPHGNDGTLNDGVKWGEGKFGKALEFDGKTGFVGAGDDKSLDLNETDFTIALWANLRALEHHTTFVGKDEGPGAKNKWFFGVRYKWFVGGDLTVHVNYPDKPGVWIASKSWAGDKGRWYQIALVKERNKYKFYVDGKVVETVENDAKIPAAATPLTIGWGEEDIYFDGLMDEFLIIKRPLTQNEILNHFKGGLTGVLAVQPPGKLTTTWGNIKAEAFRNLR